MTTSFLSAAADKRERIAKRMAHAGLCSRRDAEQWILDGRVSVNGEVIDTPAFTVTAEDKVVVDGKVLGSSTDEQPRLFRFNKPEGYLCTTQDPEGRATVFDILPKNMPRLVLVGRLDYTSEGLLLLTDSPSLAHIMMRPETGLKRTYKVRLNGSLTDDQVRQLQEGVEIDGMMYRPAEVAFLGSKGGRNTWILMTLSEGKNREIRRLMEYFGLRVSRLIRLAYGPFVLGDLMEGELNEVPQHLVRRLAENLEKGEVSGQDAPHTHVMGDQQRRFAQKMAAVPFGRGDSGRLGDFSDNENFYNGNDDNDDEEGTAMGFGDKKRGGFGGERSRTGQGSGGARSGGHSVGFSGARSGGAGAPRSGGRDGGGPRAAGGFNKGGFGGERSGGSSRGGFGAPRGEGFGGSREGRSFGGDRGPRAGGFNRSGEGRSEGGFARRDGGQRFAGNRDGGFKPRGEGFGGQRSEGGFREGNRSEGRSFDNCAPRGEGNFRSEGRGFGGERDGNRAEGRDGNFAGNRSGGRAPYGENRGGGFKPRGEGFGGQRSEGRSFGGDRAPRSGGGFRSEGSRSEGGERRPFRGDRPEGGQRFDGQNRGYGRPEGGRSEGGFKPRGEGFGGGRSEGQGFGNRAPRGERSEGGFKPRGEGFAGQRSEGRSFGGDRAPRSEGGRAPYGEGREGGNRGQGRSIGGREGGFKVGGKGKDYGAAHHHGRVQGAENPYPARGKGLKQGAPHKGPRPRRGF